MTETTVGDYKVSCAFQAGEAKEGVDYLSFEISSGQSSPLPKSKLFLNLPSEWLCQDAARKLKDLKAEDSQNVGWRMDSSSTPTSWQIALRRLSGAPKAVAFALKVSLPVARRSNKAEIKGLTLAIADGDPQPLAPVTVQVEIPRPLARIVPSPPLTDALDFGQEVTFRFILENVEAEASLHGSMENATQVSVTADSAITVQALEAASYTLSATGKDRTQFTHTVALNVKTLTSGVRLYVRPARILPGGPFSCSYSAANITRMDFAIEGGAPATRPGTSNRSIRDVKNPKGSFTVDHGPVEEGGSYKMTCPLEPTDQGAVDPKSQPNVAAVSSATLQGKVGQCLPEVPKAVAAGQFLYSERRGEFPVASPTGTMTAEWIAAATERGLALRFSWEFNGNRLSTDWAVVDPSPCPALTAYGPSSTHRTTLAYVVRRDASLVLRVLDVAGLVFPNAEAKVTDAKAKIGAPMDKEPSPRMLALGDRLYLHGQKGAWSFNLTDADPAQVTESGLAMVPYSWELAAIPGSVDGQGNLYALDKVTGTMLRFDSPGKGLALTGPHLAMAANSWLVKLDHLHRIQSGADNVKKSLGSTGQILTPATFPPQQGGLKAFKYLEIDPGLVDGGAALVAVGGALLARCTLEETRGRKGLFQGRAYDPRVNAWVRCGRLLPAARDALFTSTRPDSHRHPNGALYGVEPNGTTRRVEGNLPSLLGFITAPLSAPPKLADGMGNWRGNSLRPGKSLEAGEFLQSSNGRYRLSIDKAGYLALHENKATKTWVGSDAKGYFRPDSALLWQTSPTQEPAKSLRMGTDGSLTLCDGGRVLWSVGPDQMAGATARALFTAMAALKGVSNVNVADEMAGMRLVLDDEGQLNIRSASGISIWQGRLRNITALEAGDWLAPGDKVYRDGATLEYQGDGNLTLKSGDRLLWAAKSNLGRAGRVLLYPNGKLTVLNRDGRETWSNAYAGLLPVPAGAKVSVFCFGSEMQIIANQDVAWRTDWHKGDSGRGLAAGHHLQSADGSHILVLQTNGDLVLFARGPDITWARVWASDTACSNGSGHQLNLDESDLTLHRPGYGVWRASERGGVKGRPYNLYPAIVKVTGDGFTIGPGANGNLDAAWYGVGREGGGYTPSGRFARQSSRRCRIINTDFNGYLMPDGSEVRMRADIPASNNWTIWVVSNVYSNYWVIMCEASGQYFHVRNAHLSVKREGFFNFGSDTYPDRRETGMASADAVFPNREQLQGYFEGLNGSIRSHKYCTEFHRYVYAAEFKALSDQNKRVLCWEENRDVSHSSWRIEDVT